VGGKSDQALFSRSLSPPTVSAVSASAAEVVSTAHETGPPPKQEVVKRPLARSKRSKSKGM
jgi:hypothetical protein